MPKTFRMGGLRLKGNKLSAGKTVETMFPSGEIAVPMCQHVGAACQPTARKGEKVKVGSRIGKSVGFVAADIHSPVSGTVLKVDKISDGHGNTCDAVFIRVEADEWEFTIDRSETLLKECILSPKEIIEKIARAGVVGMGGTPFPSHVKLTPLPGTKIETLIVNGVECEPYMTSDHAMMLEKTAEILVGTSILMQATGAASAIIAVGSDKEDAFRQISRAAESYPAIKIISLLTKFPQGSEKQLIDTVLGIRIPGGALPVSKGVVVQNVSTVFAVYEAVQKNKPQIERIVTVTGDAVVKPCNVRVRIGTPVGRLIDFAGGLPEATGKIVAGGPITGKALSDMSSPVVKGMRGILIIPASESVKAKTEPCTRCAKCVEACPMGLDPSALMVSAEKKRLRQAEKQGVADCIECGLCSYICPSGLPVLHYIRSCKTEAMSRIRTLQDW